MFIKSKKNLLKESAILIAFFITISGCSKGDDEESAVSSTGGTEESYSSSTETALPEGHPPAGTAASEPLTISDHSTVKSTKQVKLDDDVKAKWNEVKIEIIDTVDTTKEVQTIKVGDTYTVRQTGFAVKILNLSPDYSIFEDYVGTRSNEANNPAVMLGKSVV